MPNSRSVDQDENAMGQKTGVLNYLVSSLLDVSGKAAHRAKVIGRKKYLRFTAILLNGASQLRGLAPG